MLLNILHSDVQRNLASYPTQQFHTQMLQFESANVAILILYLICYIYCYFCSTDNLTFQGDIFYCTFYSLLYKVVSWSCQIFFTFLVFCIDILCKLKKCHDNSSIATKSSMMKRFKSTKKIDKGLLLPCATLSDGWVFLIFHILPCLPDDVNRQCEQSSWERVKLL